MATLRIFSAGAARSVTQQLADLFALETGHRVDAEFAAVGAINARVVGGEPVDVVIVTSSLIEQLQGSGHIAPGERHDLGKVGTGAAVRTGTPLPDVSSTRALRGNLLAANRIICPDPAIATAGKILMRALELLGVADQVRSRLHFFPNGHAAMNWLSVSTGLLEIGITQITEILPIRGVTYVGPLPEELQMRTVYSIGVASNAPNPDAAREFLARALAPSARPMLKAAGYEIS
jgi:molybdate transport system substrate-binding protein